MVLGSNNDEEEEEEEEEELLPTYTIYMYVCTLYTVMHSQHDNIYMERSKVYSCMLECFYYRGVGEDFWLIFLKSPK